VAVGAHATGGTPQETATAGSASAMISWYSFTVAISHGHRAKQFFFEIYSLTNSRPPSQSSCLLSHSCGPADNLKTPSRTTSATDPPEMREPALPHAIASIRTSQKVIHADDREKSNARDLRAILFALRSSNLPREWMKHEIDHPRRLTWVSKIS